MYNMKAVVLAAIVASSFMISCTCAFVSPKTFVSSRHVPFHNVVSVSKLEEDVFDRVPVLDVFDDKNSVKDWKVGAAMASSLALWVSTSEVVMGAAGPDWGIFEGRTGSLIHPVAMGAMLLLSLSTAYLGIMYRRQRTIGDDIASLKKQLPDLKGAKSIQDALSQAKQEQEQQDSSYIAALQSAIPIENEIQSLQKERKDLSGKSLREKHYNRGSLLAFIGTTAAIIGPLNTYARAGKLFPGPHLYAGAGLVVLWAAAVACVPHMQRGSDTARTLHIAANVSGIGLFAWQVVSGWGILTKVVELTSWP